LKRLKLERIDLYQLHRIDPKVPVEESLGALKKMQEAGKIRPIALPAPASRARLPRRSLPRFRSRASEKEGVAGILAELNPEL